MNVLVTDQDLTRKLIRDRRKCGGDRYDEVWNGVYVMSPLANMEHQEFASYLGAIFHVVLAMTGQAKVYTGTNVSDREEGWIHNYRVPDVAVVYPGGACRIAESTCVGGPDFVIEIKSRGDRSRQKRGFYAAIGVRELMIIDRRPWAIELYRLADGQLNLIGKSTLDDSQTLVSEVIPFQFRLFDEAGQPKIEVIHRTGEPRWVV